MPEEFPNSSYNNPSLNLSSRIPWNSLDSRLSSCRYWGEGEGEVECDQGWIYDR